MSHRAEQRRLRIDAVLTHPLWLASLGLLVLNDHVLKGSGLLPGVVTGKLSDVAGMLVAPALLALLLRVRTKRGLALAHVAVGLGFAALEMSATLTAMAGAVYGAFARRWASTSDWTDLLTLLVLPLSFWWSAAISGRPASRSRVARVRNGLLAAGGLLACVASEDGGGTFQCNGDCDQDGFGVAEDCNDYDATINPAAGNCPGSDGTESCDNGVDDNGDSLLDCNDPRCAVACEDTLAACSVPTQWNAATGKLTGSTLTGTWALEGSCGGADAPENIFNVYADRAGTLTIPVPEGHVIYARDVCSFAYLELACVDPEANEFGEDEDEPFVIQLAQDDVITLVIDAADSLDAAEYELDVTFTSTSCGDGVVDSAIEECDDGNTDSEDGCSSSCVLEPEVLCAELVPLPDGPSTTTFEGGTRYLASTCGDGDEFAPEQGFVYEAPAAGVLTVSATTPGTSIGLFAQSQCPGPIVACSPHVQAGEQVDLAIPLAAGAKTYVFVEGLAATPVESTVSLTATFVPN